MVRSISVAGFAILYASLVLAVPMPDSDLGNELDAYPSNSDHSGSTPTYKGYSPSYSTPTDKGYGGYGNSGSSGGKSDGYNSPSPTSTPYGSGGNNWGSGSSGYDSCVQQCQAQWGSPSSGGGYGGGSGGGYGGSSSGGYGGSSSGGGGYGSGNSGSGGYGGGSSSNGGYGYGGGSSGGGATHTVIVAPSQGVLRYVPFAVNASVGDTVKFMWGANNHTVTKSSLDTPCNKTSDGLFASGIQLQDFTFEQVINDTDPVIFYCGVPEHCQKGMFGIINPPSASDSSSVGSMMSQLAANDSQIKSMVAFAANATSGNSVATGWGQNINMSAMPDWSQQFVAEGVLYTQVFLASNPDAVKSDGSIDVGMNGNPAVVPPDITAAVNYGNPTTPSGSSSAGSPSSTPASTTKQNGASAISRSGAFVGFAALAAGFFLF